MAKSGDKAAGRKADGKQPGGKPRIPKKIGGVKIPKEARRAGEALIDKAQSPAGRQAIASGLAMAATVAAAAMARKAQHAAPQAPSAPSSPSAASANDAGAARTGQSGIVDPQQIADAIGQVADTVLGKIFGARTPG